MGFGGKTTWKVTSLRPICWPNVFNISGPEIDEITSPDSPLSTSLYLHRSIHSSFSSSLSHAHSSVVQKVCPMCLDASCFFTACHIFVFVLCRCCVTCVMCPWWGFQLLFLSLWHGHFRGITAHANTSMLLRVPHYETELLGSRQTD